MGKKYYAMVITSHADDAEYGVAGTVVKWVRDGKKVVCGLHQRQQGHQ